MSYEQHLQREQEALQKQYDLLSEKRSNLRQSHAIEVDAAVRFKLTKQIEQTEAELDEIKQQLQKIATTSDCERLHHALLKLGYQAQVRSFNRFIDVKPIGAFLIHGSLYYGQRWLLNRLARRHVPQNVAGKNVIVDLSRIARQSDTAALWRELARRVGLNRHNTNSEITERVYQWWQTQNVLLIFHNVHILPESFLEELLQDFWLPLVAKVRSASTEDKKFKLLMFLVDYDGCVGSWKMTFAEQLVPTWNSGTPVKLPEINEFSEDDLENWLWQGYEAEELPTKLVEENVDKRMQTILENSDNGIPEPAMEEICRLSGIDWYEHEGKWLNL